MEGEWKEMNRKCKGSERKMEGKWKVRATGEGTGQANERKMKGKWKENEKKMKGKRKWKGRLELKGEVGAQRGDWSWLKERLGFNKGGASLHTEVRLEFHMEGKWKENERWEPQRKGQDRQMKGKWKEKERKMKGESYRGRDRTGKWKENERKMKGESHRGRGRTGKWKAV